MAIPLLMSCGQEVDEIVHVETERSTSPTVEDMMTVQAEEDTADSLQTPKSNWKTQPRKRGLFVKKECDITE